MQRTTSAALAAVTISSLLVAATAAGASVPGKADPQKVCDAIASQPETSKQELAAIRLAQSGKNPELTKALAALEKAAQKALKTKDSAATQTRAYNLNLAKVFEFGVEECTDTQVEATTAPDGLTGVPATVDAGSVGFKIQNDTDENVFIGVVKVAADNTASADEIVASIYASENEAPDGVEFVASAGAEAGEAGYALGDLEAGRYLLFVGAESEERAGTPQIAEFTVA